MKIFVPRFHLALILGTVTFLSASAQSWKAQAPLVPPLIPQQTGGPITVSNKYAAGLQGFYNGLAQSVFVLKNVNGQWKRDTLIFEPNALYYPGEIEISDSTLAVSSAKNVYVYDRVNGLWTLTQTIPFQDPVQIGPYGENIIEEVSIHGNHLVIGGYSAFAIYERIGATWQKKQQLSYGGGTTSISIEVSDSILVQASWYSGNAAVYELTGGTWQKTGTIVGSGKAGDAFGRDIAIDEHRIFVTEMNTENVYQYEKIAGTWTRTQMLDYTSAQEDGQFVSVSGNTMVATTTTNQIVINEWNGTEWKNISTFHNYPFVAVINKAGDILATNHSDSVLVIRKKPGGDWAVAQVYIPLGDNAINFGSTISADSAFIGVASNENPFVSIFKSDHGKFKLQGEMRTTNNNVNIGIGMAMKGKRFAYNETGYNNVDAVQIYEYDGNAWINRQTIYSPEPAALLSFGNVIRLDTTWMLISGHQYTTAVAYFYHYEDGQWVYKQKITEPSQWQVSEWSLGISGSYAVLASGAYTGPQALTGKAIVYKLNGTKWNRIQEIAGNANDTGFAMSVGLSGSHLGVLSAGTSVKPEHLYMYELRDTLFQQSQVLSPESGKYFSYNFAIKDNVVVIGYNADPFFDVYGFKTGTWTLGQAVRDQPQLNNQFGITMDVADKNTLYFGAPTYSYHGSNSSGAVIPYTGSNFPGPILIAPFADQYALVGNLFSLNVDGAFADGSSGPLTYSLSLSNGNALPSWLVFNSSTNSLSGTPALSDVGLLNIKCTATDGTSVSTSFNLKVVAANSAPVLVVPVPDLIVADLDSVGYSFAGTFQDPDGDPMKYSVTIPDNTFPAWLRYDPTPAIVISAPAHTNQSRRVVVTATDPFGLKATSSFIVTVTDSIVVAGTGDHESNFSLYPNPASYYIKVEGTSAEDIAVSFTSFTGAQLLTHQVNGDAAINIEALPEGLCIVSFKNLRTGIVVRKKLVVIR